MTTVKFLKGWYRVSGQFYFSNVKLERNGEWSIDLRRRSDSELVEVGSLWNTKRDAVEEAERIIARKDERYIVDPVSA